MTSISAIIWGDSDRIKRREGGVTVGQVVFPPVPPKRTVDTYTPEQERRASDFLARGKKRSNAHGLGE